MNEQIRQLVEISHFYGNDKSYVIAGGGNSSYKNEDRIWIKASGTSMRDVNEDNFAVLDRHMLKTLYTKEYSTDSIKREAEVKADLMKACVEGSSARPSVETSLHELIGYSYVMHTHPLLVNAITCSNNAGETLAKIFGDAWLFVPYTDPGYVLFNCVKATLEEWRKSHGSDPKVIFLQNHGVFVSSDSCEEIRSIYKEIESIIRLHIQVFPDISPTAVPETIVKFLPALRMILSDDEIKVSGIRNNQLIQHFTASSENFSGISDPFTPDQIVYCKAHPLFIEAEDPESIISECREKVKAFVTLNGYTPRIVVIKGYGIAAFDSNIKSVETILDIFDDWMQISYLSENFGGPHFMSNRDVEFIDNWEVENYRRQVGREVKKGRIENKVAIVTGGAQGFGEGIVTGLMKEGANVIIADLNKEKGSALALRLNSWQLKNEAYFSPVDVTSADSVRELIYNTVVHFGGLDIMISNAGVLHAGGLEEMKPETFEFITKVNYTGYFNCVSQACAVMKLQAANRNDYFTDIIQINSKSGLKGSNRNFAYAGSKFGSIGLTQSFALELMPWKIKVNAICPGNFFEGPLWSDPETGLFVQYLRAGKVPGATSVNDVKAYYEKQVPAGRGCHIEDVMKAILYVIDQEYETGQAVPVTGGQLMLK